jgi:hypothetical protein
MFDVPLKFVREKKLSRSHEKRFNAPSIAGQYLFFKKQRAYIDDKLKKIPFHTLENARLIFEGGRQKTTSPKVRQSAAPDVSKAYGIAARRSSTTRLWADGTAAQVLRDVRLPMR